MTDLHDGRGEGEDGGGESRSILQGSKKVTDIRLIILLRSSRNPRTPLSTNVRQNINATNPVIPPRLVTIILLHTSTFRRSHICAGINVTGHLPCFSTWPNAHL
jgi:hypothetical protein